MVNGADTATSYGRGVVLVQLHRRRQPGSTVGGPDALMSPCVSASVDTGNETCTVLDCPASSVTRVKPDQPLRRHDHAAHRLGHVHRDDVRPATRPRCCVTVKVAVTVPCLDTFGVTDRSLVVNVV